MSTPTVETYRARIKEKLGLTNAAQLHAKAAAWASERHAVAG